MPTPVHMKEQVTIPINVIIDLVVTVADPSVAAVISVIHSQRPVGLFFATAQNGWASGI